MAVMAQQTDTTVAASSAELESLVIGLLADHLGVDAISLAAELAEKGSLMPVDSLDLFDIVPKFRRLTGLKLPVRKLGTKTMRSVKAFAAFAAKESE